MGSRKIGWIVVALLMSGVARPAHGEITADQVREAIRLGVDYLKAAQNKTIGNWEEYENQPGGLSALCTLALINSGVPLDDPSLARALNYLRRLEPNRTYSVALQTMVLCAAEPEKDRLLIRRNVQWLERNKVRWQTNLGVAAGWGYSDRSISFDNSNTQFALLALYEAERVGVSLQADTWELIRTHWRALQNRNGSWSYQRDMAGTGSMTCAGIASMVIASGRAGERRATVDGDVVRCCGAEASDEDWVRIEAGLEWLARHFSVRVNPGDSGNLLYYLYGVERVGRLTGRRLIGNRDWYREGADYLYNMQTRTLTGYWVGDGIGEDNRLVGTSLALLFLSKGRRPVLISKLKYGQRDTWDYHTGGVPNLSRRVELSWKRDLTWQTTELAAASVEQLLESPILFLSGSDAFRFGPQEQEKLRQYIAAGGFIFAEAREGHGCDGSAFDDSFRRLVAELFPDNQLRLLPPDHPVWYADGKVDANYLRPLLGIDACCRTSIVYCPRNLSCFWELADERGLSSLPQSVRDEIDACLQIGQNVAAYATNRILKDKLDRPQLALADADNPATDRGVLSVGKLSHTGGSDDAPRALPNLLRYVRNEMQVRTRVENQLVRAGDPRLYEYPVLFMQGRFDFRWPEEERAALVKYLENGGVLLADAICASPAFAAAFRREMSTLFPQTPLVRIPPNHPLFSARFGGFDLDRVQLNDPQARTPREGLATRRVAITPLLEGIEINGRLAVIFSPYDLSCALENHNAPECKGYVRDDALRIGLNVLLYALQQ